MADQPNFIEVQKYLGGIDYPCTGEELAQAAEGNGAPSEVVEHLRGLGDQQFEDPTEVTKAITGDQE